MPDPSLEHDCALVLSTVARARRRMETVSAIEQLGLALCAALLALCVLLIFGASAAVIAVMVVFGLAALSFCLLRFRATIRPPYAIAQQVDDRLQLNDLLSTGFQMSLPEGEALYHPEARRHTLHASRSAMQGVDLKLAYPGRGKEGWRVAAGLTVLVLLLTLLRYRSPHALLFRLPQAAFGMPSATPGRTAAEQLSAQKKSGLPALSPGAPGREREASEHQRTAREREQSAAELPGVSNNPAGRDQDHASSAAGSSEAHGENQSGQAASSSTAKAAANLPSQNGLPAKPGHEATDGTKGSSQPAQSMASRVREALQSMMSKMTSPSESTPAASRNEQSQGNHPESNIQPSSNAARSEAADAKADRGAANQQSGKAESRQADAEENTGGSSNSSGQNKSASKQAKANGDSQGNNSGAESGVGRQEGDKEIRTEAEARAMGKLSEILSQRSAQLTGDMTLDAQSGRQQLQTNYSNRQASHSNSDSEIESAEIPLEYQAYVKAYLDRLRDSARTAKHVKP